MHTINVRLLLSLIILMCPLAGAESANELTLPKKHVLLIYSYHPGFPTSPQSLEGIRAVFGKNTPVIDIEYLDAKRIYDNQSVSNFLRSLQYKQEHLPPYDLIMTADDYALRLVLEHADHQFKNIPVVFYGVNNIELAEAQDENPNVTGVIEASSFRETIALHQQLQPQRKRLNIVVDGTLSGQADLKTVQGLLPEFTGLEFSVISLANLSWSQFGNSLGQLGNKDAILFLSAYQDAREETKAFEDSLAFVKSRTDVPIWHLWEHGVGSGMLGGVLISHRQQGLKAAEMARRILLGESPDQIHVLNQSPNLPVFDYNQLQHYGIPIESLPENAVVLNQPQSLWEHYRRELTFAAILLVALVTFTLWLMHKNRLLLRIRADLESSREGLRKLSQAVEQSPLPVFITDTHAHIEYVNGAFSIVTGYPITDMKGRNPNLLSAGETPKTVYEDLWKTITSGRTWQGEWQNRRKSGDNFWARVVISPVMDDRGAITHYVCILEDISLQKSQEARIYYQAHFDALTGLANRFLVVERLNLAIAEARQANQKVAVLFIDLDDFKTVNDALGHEAGDNLLKLAASRLRGVVREQDTVGRLGGDEFVVILNHLENAEDAIATATHILMTFRNPFQYNQQEIVLTASLGISISPTDGKNHNELLRKADIAMYTAKRQGRNNFRFFTPDINS
ncbi:MAG: diguanylate cyclase [Hahellaceae bacterium]|nr:diguanylate cyclase [Hahellaceae bacterium]